ncbi:MAG: outer membrane protein assembly factor BamC [Burkholderiales bacterium]
MRPFARRAGRVLVVAALAAAAAGCSVSDAVRDATAVDYKRASKGPPLDIPPDLVKPRGDDRFAIPERPSGGTTFSDFSRERGAERPQATGAAPVLAQPQGTRIERQGTQRWLVVELPPEKVWPVVRDFWVEAGFALRVESPETGILETDWAEKRARVPDSWFRNQMSRALNSLYSTAERDKFRTRLETDGKRTEIYISHRGMVEEFQGAMKESTVWVQRPSDPELEVEFLRRLMLRLGGPVATQQVAVAPSSSAAAAAAAAPLPPDRARIVEADGRPQLQLQDGFDRSWRQVGLALDRGGFTVEDRDRSKGTYFVRYVDPEQEAKARGVFDRVFGTGQKKDLTGKRYRIVLADGGSGGTRVGVLGEDGAPPSADADKRIASNIVSLLRDQLR